MKKKKITVGILLHAQTSKVPNNLYKHPEIEGNTKNDTNISQWCLSLIVRHLRTFLIRPVVSLVYKFQLINALASLTL